MNSALLKLPFRRIKRRLNRLLQASSPENFSEIDLLHEQLTAHVGSGGVMVDVGAQFGESFFPFTLFGWRILAFEPDPNPAKQASLLKLVDRKVEVARVAVSDREKPAATFFTSEESTGISSLCAFRETHKPTASVKVSTLALELAAKTITHIDFLKIDTEGFDLFVLRGFPWTRTDLRPRAILCEFEDAKTKPLGYDWQEMAAFLHEQGYIVLVSEWHPIVRYGVKHRWRSVRRYPTELSDPQGWGNLVAFLRAEEANAFEKAARKYSPS